MLFSQIIPPSPSPTESKSLLFSSVSLLLSHIDDTDFYGKVMALFFNINLFNWRLITFQYCSGFCHTLTWISHGCTCVPHPELLLPPPSASHPSGSSQCTSPEHPVSCIEPGLVIYFTYGNIHVSMLFSQIIPPLPSPTEFKSLFFTSVSLLLSHI